MGCGQGGGACGFRLGFGGLAENFIVIGIIKQGIFRGNLIHLISTITRGYNSRLQDSHVAYTLSTLYKVIAMDNENFFAYFYIMRINRKYIKW